MTVTTTTHLNFAGTARAALDFYAEVFGGTVTAATYADFGMPAEAPGADGLVFGQIAGERTLTIENGADLSKFANRSSLLPVKRMVTLGRFSVNKRLENLIRAMAALVKTDPEWHLDIAGVASDLTEADLRAEIAAQGLDRHVSLHVGLGNEAVAELVGRSSLFVSASEYEGFGLVAIEAMSAGLVPVLHENEAYGQLSRRHSGIALTDFTDAGKAARCISDTYRGLEQHGAALRDRLIREAQTYSWTAVAGSYVEAYARAVPALALPVI